MAQTSKKKADGTKVPLAGFLFVVTLLCLAILVILVALQESTQRLSVMREALKVAVPSTVRDDLLVTFTPDILDTLSKRYSSRQEHFFCLIGGQEGATIHVESLVEQDVVANGLDYIIYEQDPPCRVEGAVGSPHTHPEETGCFPSFDDFFTFGEMKNPEPLINIVQCGTQEFYILKMPGAQESLDLRSLPWTAG